VGEPRKHLYEILDWVVPILPEDKPRYLMGLGRPDELVSAVNDGIDMFDCVIPTREGRHGRLFVFKNNFDIERCLEKSEGLFYKTINIGNEKFKEEFLPIDTDCQCETCKNYTLAYLHHLFKTKEPLFLKLASVHNLFFYHSLMKMLRK
ncbi:MAG: tRNA-guanine transglycosylase, partial [Candidatus Moranbacteria bacterium]|nr:tRNA-guanine transglycosylase [Candidatus Moranbacteria bacterium]